MAVSLDLADPVSTVVTLLDSNLSLTPHIVTPGFIRGGYDWGTNKPRIIPIEGETRDGKYYFRQHSTLIASIPGKHEIYVMKIAKNIDTATQTSDHKFADKICQITIDIRTAGGLPNLVDPREKLYSLFREIEAIIYISKTTPGGNWSEIDPGQDLELSSGSAGLWRITYDVELKKISDFIGSA